MADAAAASLAHASPDLLAVISEWIRLLRSNGFQVLDLVELEPPADAVEHPYYNFVELDWARRWPAEEVWVAEKSG